MIPGVDDQNLPGQDPNVPPPPDPHAGWSDSIGAWYRQYLGRTPSQQEIDSWINGGTPIQNMEQAIANSPEAKAYAASQAAGSTPTTPHPGGGGWVGAPATLTAPFPTTFVPPARTAYPDAPTFTAPTFAQAANDPGYQFTVDQGRRNLEGWLASHGTFNDSSAANALQQFGQGAAATQYNNVWNRAYTAYQGALDPWRTDVATIQHDNDMSWQNAFNSWLQQWNIWRDQRDSTFNKQFQVATA